MMYCSYTVAGTVAAINPLFYLLFLISATVATVKIVYLLNKEKNKKYFFKKTKFKTNAKVL